MEVKIWGSRGGMPVASQDVLQFGGNTACISVETSSKDLVILDAGTGIQDLGKTVETLESGVCHVFLTHYHWDHIQGLPYFIPLYKNNWIVHIYGGAHIDKRDVKDGLAGLFHPSHFPVTIDKFDKRIVYHDVSSADSIKVGSAQIDICDVNHPGGGLAYKVTDTEWSFVYSGDHEHIIGSDSGYKFEEFIKNVDMLIADSQYNSETYTNHEGWGHTCLDIWPKIAANSNIRHLVLTHHDMTSSDDDLDYYSNYIKTVHRNLPIEITFARDGISFPNPEIVKFDNSRILSNWLTDLSKELSGYNDVSTILDSILSEARRVSKADAGTVYLAEGTELIFAYAHNDTLFPGSQNNKLIYTNARMPIDHTSIAGYAATYCRQLNIPDVYNIPANEPYSFNDSFDKKAGYRTSSVLAVPFMGHGNKLLGVVQLINSIDGGKIVPFTKQIQSRLQLLSIVVANAVEKGMLADELLLRMLKMSSLRDPTETAGHVRRVGAVSSEIYQYWAKQNKVPFDEMRQIKDKMRIAAMLHDVGKVGIPDSVLKKPGKLDAEERLVIERHCYMGADLFVNVEWSVDSMAREITQHHHQKWDGSGYTGNPDVPVLSGEDIPLAARITTIADVYDALISKRSYKDPIGISEAVSIIKDGAGSHFDPKLVDCFTEILDTVDAIYNLYGDLDWDDLQMKN